MMYINTFQDTKRATVLEHTQIFLWINKSKVKNLYWKRVTSGLVLLDNCIILLKKQIKYSSVLALDYWGKQIQIKFLFSKRPEIC